MKCAFINKPLPTCSLVAILESTKKLSIWIYGHKNVLIFRQNKFASFLPDTQTISKGKQTEKNHVNALIQCILFPVVDTWKACLRCVTCHTCTYMYYREIKSRGRTDDHICHLSSIKSALYAWNLWEPNVNGEACQSNNERKVSMAYLTR